jgi:Fur family transcriptional regulator, ferric uptake regulator
LQYYLCMIEENFKKALRKNNLFLTSDRIRLFQELKSLESPCSIAQLVALTKGDLNTTTVYRNLEIFEEIGVVQRLYSGWKYKVELTDSYSPHHHHMICNKCQAVISFNEPENIITALDEFAKSYSFKIESHSLELKGTCKSCCMLL